MDLNAQNTYFYVYDLDGFVNVRSEPDIHAAVVDTFYHLEVINEFPEYSTNGWSYVEAKTGKSGYVHRSILVKLSEITNDYLDSLKTNIATIFIASIDCPEIIVVCNGISKVNQKKKGITYFGNTTYNTFEFKVDDYCIVDTHTKKFIDIRNPIDPISFITQTEARLIFVDEINKYDYTFYENKNGKKCLNVISGRDYSQYESIENRSVLNTFNQFLSEIKKGNRYSEIIEVNDFEFLNKIRSMYYSGVEEVQPDYLYFLHNLPLDGEGSHAIEKYYSELWGYLNRGETKIEDVISLATEYMESVFF